MSKARVAFERLGAVALIAFVVVLASDVSAQNYPSRTGRIVVPFQPGGGADIQARILGKKF
ncbi:MAG: tripartite tricarboxylate transporter substrate binding protein, partial [Burkholderiales bacterium]